MGFDLRPLRPNKKYPRKSLDDPWKSARPKWLHYNIFTWGWLVNISFRRGGIPVEAFPQTNDGERIPSAICKKVAKTIRNNESYLQNIGADWLIKDADSWENSGGFSVR